MTTVVQEEAVHAQEEAGQVLQADVADAAVPGINFHKHIYK